MGDDRKYEFIKRGMSRYYKEEGKEFLDSFRFAQGIESQKVQLRDETVALMLAMEEWVWNDDVSPTSIYPVTAEYRSMKDAARMALGSLAHVWKKHGELCKLEEHSPLDVYKYKGVVAVVNDITDGDPIIVNQADPTESVKSVFGNIELSVRGVALGRFTVATLSRDPSSMPIERWDVQVPVDDKNGIEVGISHNRGIDMEKAAGASQ